jgi:hypothetical protein
MAGPKQSARVEVISPTGERGTVAPEDVASLPDGARVLTAQELAQERVEAQYAKRSLAEKAIAFGITGDINPELGAYQEAAHSAASAGIIPAAKRAALDTVGPAGAGAQYARRVDDVETASPTASTAGSVAGFLGGTAATMASGGATGLGGAFAKATPLGALSAAGAPVEAAVAKSLAGLGTRGVLGKAAQHGAASAVRGALEGAAYSATEQVASDYLHDEHTTGSKLYSAGKHGAIMGGLIGGALGATGSLIGSGLDKYRAAKALRLEAGEVPPPLPPRTEIPFIDADAGLKADVGPVEKPFSIGAERRPVGLRPGGRPRVEVEEPISLTGRLSIDPDAGLHAPRGKVAEPLYSNDVKLTDLFTDAAEQRPVRLASDVFRKGEKPLPSTARPIRQRFDIGLDPDAGLGAASKTEEALRLSSAKKVPHDVDISLNETVAPSKASSPITIPELPLSPFAKEARSFFGSMADAGEHAWRAVGAGFGLQTSRYAKEAAKYFEGKTSEVGRIAIKHGLIDMAGAEGKSAPAAAWQAAKSGRPEDILPKAELALETVGKKIGELTDSSGARVTREQVLASIDDVAKHYERSAATKPVGRSIRAFGEDLIDSLGLHAEGSTAPVQQALVERKGIDRLAFRDAPTLDPKAQLEAKRRLSGSLEEVISQVMDQASGRLPGELRAEYAALKKDYHGLRILTEAAEDSAARSSKAATLGLSEKFAVANAVASGNFVAAPILAMGGKMLKERGNAAAAAFLTRASMRGSFDASVRAFERRLDSAASGVLTAGDKGTLAQAAGRQREPRRDIVVRVPGRSSRDEEKQTQAQAEQIVKWVGDMNANPMRVTQQVEETAAEIARAIGPKAAEGYSASQMRAIAFIAGYIPVKERRDPLDPRSIPPLMRDEAIRLVRATKYALRPESIFEDFGRGVITPEGLRAAKHIDPDSFEEFQLKLQSHVENHMLRNRQLTQSQRLRIDKLLGYPAGADLRPKSIARRQANYDQAMNDPSGSPPAPTGNGPVNMNTQQSGFDAIESRMAG